MNRSKKSRADTLRDLRASERARLNSRLVDGTSSIGELRDLSERVQLLDAAIKQEEPPRTAKRLAFIALAVATVIIAAASMRMPSVRFSLEAEAHSISLRAGAAQSLSGFPSGSELRVTDGCGVLSSSNIGLTSAVRGQQADPLTLRATSLAVQHLTFGASSLLTVTPGGNALQVSVENSTAPIAIELEMSGDANGFFGDSTTEWRESLNGTHWVTLTSPTARPNLENTVALCSFTTVLPARTVTRLEGAQPVAITFVQPGISPSGLTRVGSSLTKARIALANVETPVSLEEGDSLAISGLEVEHFELLLDDRAHLRLTGTARTLTTRRGPTESSLKPTVLEFTARDHSIASVWSGLVFLWGLTAWLRPREH